MATSARPPHVNSTEKPVLSRWWSNLTTLWNRLAFSYWGAIILVGSLPLIVRVAMLPWHPIPKPQITDEFSHLLIADTLAAGRVANPTHPFADHFETIYEFQRPVYASKYMPGQGLVMAAGQVIGGHPWWGVWASCGIMCGAVCWMLYGWVSPSWALVGGLLCVFRIGILSYWINSYLGGSVTAFGGALALGALPRLLKSRKAGWAAAFASGLAITVSVRIYEGLLFSVALLILLAAWLVRAKGMSVRQITTTLLAPIAAVFLLAAAAFGYYNFRITGKAWLTPYQLSQRMYGVPRGFIFQARLPKPDVRFQDQRQVYEWQFNTTVGIKKRWRMFREFYLGPGLIIALLFLPLARKDRAVYELAGVCVFVCAGTLLYWYFLEHYLAPITAALFGLVVIGLRELWNWKLVNQTISRLAAVGIVLFDITSNISAGYQGVAMGPVGRKFVNFAESRSKIEEQLQRTGGQHLVFVRTGPKHPFEVEWIYNRADIDRAQIIWAREIDPESDARLAANMSGRSVWLADVDARPVQLSALRTKH
jgi:hypothetical protein